MDRYRHSLWTETLILSHGEQLYTTLLDRLRADLDVVAAMWDDAESRPDELDQPHTIWSVVVLEDGAPAAWCAATIRDDGTIKCHSNYETRAWRDHGLYADAYQARHRHVVLAYGVPAVTYLFAQPIGLHEADGWTRTGQHGPGVLPGHHWWELRHEGTRP